MWAQGAKMSFSDRASPGVLIDQVSLGRRRMAELLLENGADPNAIYHGTTALIAAARRGDRLMLQALLARDAAPNQPDATGLTPLMAACLAGRLDVAAALLAAGADPRARTTGGDTAAHFATTNDQFELLKLLCETGADPAAKNGSGDSPLVLAVRSQFSRSARLLAERGARIDLQHPAAADLLRTAIRLDLAPVLQAALADGWPATTRLQDRWTALQVAELSEATDCAKLLRAAGATLDPGAVQPLARTSELTSSPVPTSVSEAVDPRPADCSAPDVTVSLEFVVDRDGRAIFPRLRHCPDPRLAEPSLNAIRRWRFAPGKRGDLAVATHVTVPIVFKNVRERVMAAVDVDTPPMLTSVPDIPEESQHRGENALRSGAKVFLTVGLRGEVEAVDIESQHSPIEREEIHRMFRDVTLTPGMRGGTMVRTRLGIPAVLRINTPK
jgi:ankyrin repeat protein